MELKEIQKLIDFIAHSGLDEVNIETSDFKVSVKKGSNIQTIIAPTTIPSPVIPQVITASNPSPIVVASPAPAENGKQITIKSPMIGTFYRASTPESPSLVEIGDEIKPGKAICVIEAMKLFNEIEAEISGKIVKVLVENASPVEFDQPLFVVESV